VRGFVLPEGSAPPRQFTTVVTDSESIRLPRRTGAKTSAMFGAGEEDDTDFLSPSGG
jgi:FK506-binding protein 15